MAGSYASLYTFIDPLQTHQKCGKEIGWEFSSDETTFSSSLISFLHIILLGDFLAALKPFKPLWHHIKSHYHLRKCRENKNIQRKMYLICLGIIKRLWNFDEILSIQKNAVRKGYIG